MSDTIYLQDLLTISTDKQTCVSHPVALVDQALLWLQVDQDIQEVHLHLLVLRSQ